MWMNNPCKEKIKTIHYLGNTLFSVVLDLYAKFFKSNSNFLLTENGRS